MVIHKEALDKRNALLHNTGVIVSSKMPVSYKRQRLWNDSGFKEDKKTSNWI